MSYLWNERLAKLATDRDRADRALSDGAVSATLDGTKMTDAEWAGLQVQTGIGYALLAIREQLERIGDHLEDPPTFGPLDRIADVLDEAFPARDAGMSGVTDAQH